MHDDSGIRTYVELVSELQALVEEVATLAKNFESDKKEVLTEFAFLVEKLTPILTDIKGDERAMDREPVLKAFESLANELRRAKEMVRDPGSRPSVKLIDNLSQDLGRSLGLVMFSSVDASPRVRETIGAVQKELMNARFVSSFSPSPSSVASANPSPSPSQSPSSVNPPSPGLSTESGFFGSEFEYEKEIEEESVTLSIEDMASQLEYGSEDGLQLALLGLLDYIKEKAVEKEWLKEVVPVLLNRLATSRPNNRLTIIHVLRTLASENPEYKEKMADVVSLSVLVKSLMRDLDEQRDAVGLLLQLSSVSAVKRRIGKLQGCIVMLVSIFNGDDPIASHDAGKLLISLSRNTQNVLHMAEAGYFEPLVLNLKEGSDMSKVLMATALSRMELTDQSKVSLGEEGAVEPLVDMFKTGNLEAKLTALNALQSLSSSAENVRRLISSGTVTTLLQLLFSVTSVLMTLREPASAILARIAQSESILVNQDVAQQMLSLLNLSSPIIQCHLLQALNSIASHSNASRVRKKMQENGAIQLLLPFLFETNINIRVSVLNFLFTLTKDLPDDLRDQLGESNIIQLVSIFGGSTFASEKAAAIGILSNLPVTDTRTTSILKKANLLPILIAEIGSTASASASTTRLLAESVAGVLIRFTVPSDKKLQLLSADLGAIPCLVKLLSSDSFLAKRRAATALAQLSQNSVALRRPLKSRWMCMPPSAGTPCEVHDSYCSVKGNFCLIKAGAISPLIQSLKEKDRESDEAVLAALATLLQDEIQDSGSNYIANASGIEAIIQALELGNVKAKERALWMLERIFKVEQLRTKYGQSAQVMLIDLAQTGDHRLRPAVARVLAELELLQVQSSYF